MLTAGVSQLQLLANLAIYRKRYKVAGEEAGKALEAAKVPEVCARGNCKPTSSARKPPLPSSLGLKMFCFVIVVLYFESTVASRVLSSKEMMRA